MSKAPPRRLQAFESHPGAWCVHDAQKKGCFPMEWPSHDEALDAAMRWLVDAAQGKRALELILDDDERA